jgi:hypothetical protein
VGIVFQKIKISSLKHPAILNSKAGRLFSVTGYLRFALGFQELPNFLAPKEPAREAPTVDLAAQSPDIAALRERMNTLHNEFTLHYATAPQISSGHGFFFPA